MSLCITGASDPDRAVASERGEAHSAHPRLIRVGPREAVATIEAASRLARDGDTVEIEAGDYVGDVTSWNQNDLTLRATGGRVRIFAAGEAAERKAIWVVKG